MSIHSFEMKLIFTLAFFITISLHVDAQSPQFMNYQGIVRDAAGEPVINKSTKFKLSIQSSSQSLVYSELQNVTTNSLGLFAIKLGQGSPIIGSFASIPWDQENYLLKIEVDINGGNNFQLLGQPEPLASVPYALQANSASSINLLGDVIGSNHSSIVTALQGKPLSTQSPNLGQVLKWNGQEWRPDNDATSGGGTYTAGQGIAINGNTISNTGDLSNSNELQQLTISGSTLSLSNGGGSVTLPTANSGYWDNAGGSDIINNNTGTVFIGSQNIPYQAIFASTSNSSQTIVAQNNGTGSALSASTTTGTSLKTQSGTGLALDALSNSFTAKIKGTVASDFGTGVVHIENTNMDGLGLSILGGLNIRGGLGTSNLVGTISFDILEGFKFGGYAILPYIDRGGNVGSSSARWNTIYASNGTINTSDVRQKQAITPITYGIKQVMNLKPISFEWKSNPEQGRNLGFIAQVLQIVIPEVVADKDWNLDQDGHMNSRASEVLGVYYSDIIPVLAKAIQEQQEMIEKLKKDNQTLLQRVENLERNKSTTNHYH